MSSHDAPVPTGTRIDVMLPRDSPFSRADVVTVCRSFERYLGHGSPEVKVPGAYFNAATGPVGCFNPQAVGIFREVATFEVGGRNARGEIEIRRVPS